MKQSEQVEKNVCELKGVIPNIMKRSMTKYKEEKFYREFGISKCPSNKGMVRIYVDEFQNTAHKYLGDKFYQFKADSNVELVENILDKYRDSLNIEADIENHLYDEEDYY